MSELLDSLCGEARRTECKKNDVLSDWHRQVASRIASAHPLTHSTPIRARGNHLAAQNDEPEATVDPMQWAFDQLHLLSMEVTRDLQGKPSDTEKARLLARSAALGDALDVLRAARNRGAA